MSRHALVMLKNHYSLPLNRENLKECTEYYTSIHGIPCTHVICGHIDGKRSIEVSDFASGYFSD